VLTQIYLALFLTVVSPAMLATDGAETTDVKGVIQQFHQALDRHDVAAIEALVSSDIVVLENGHRNDGWPDFRDNHLIPEFKEPATPSKWEFVKVAASSEMAWGYTKQTINATGKDGKPTGYLVWSTYVLQKTGPAWKVVLLDWSVRRLNDGN
jgi:ketosteroid isomerase-like protein